MTKQYKTAKEIYRVGKEYYNDKGHCSVVTVAVACGVAYGRALKEMTAAGRKHRQGASIIQIHHAINKLGYSLKVVRLGKNGTVSTLTNKLPNKGTYIAFVKGHVLTVRDGVVIDWSEGRRHRIIEVLEVIKD